MPLLPWTALVETSGQAHLVVAAVDPDSQSDARTELELLKRLLRKLKVEGDYAATIARTPQGAEICCAFVRSSDADRLAAFGDARPSAIGAAWATARRFILDASARQRITEVAGPPQARRPLPTR